jgi:NADH dehydrogenase
MLKKDNVVSQAARDEGRTLEGLGIAPDGIEAVVPDYLTRYSATGQFAIVHDALAAMLLRS